MAKGGYRKPENPAPVSGPGALSQRTDGGPAQGAKYMSGLPYGENTMDQQTAAPMAGKASPPPTPTMSFPNFVELGAPTERPDEPGTSGINRGEGPGSEALQLPNRAPSLVDTIKYLVQFDPSGDAELIFRSLSDQGIA